MFVIMCVFVCEGVGDRERDGGLSRWREVATK